MTVNEAKRMERSTDPAVRETAKRVLAANKRQKEMRKRHRDRSPGPTKAERREAHRAATTLLRAQAWERCGGRDEVTGEELGTAWELHHVESGGHRRSRQCLGNVLAISWETHRRIHRGDLDTLLAVRGSPTLDHEARAAMDRRIAKVAEAREYPERRSA